MFDDFDITMTCEEFYMYEEYEDEPLEEEEEREDFPDDYWLEVGFNPYEGCYDWDC